jgi:predicted  nucleic acid-binding Zn-ribbon protein
VTLNEVTMTDSQKFIEGLVTALSNDKVLDKLKEHITEPLSFQIKKLQDDYGKLKNELLNVTENNKQLKNEMSNLRVIIQKKDSEILKLNEKVNSFEWMNKNNIVG